MSSTRAPLTQSRQEAVADVFPPGRLYFPGLQRVYPGSDLLAPSGLDIGLRLGLYNKLSKRTPAISARSCSARVSASCNTVCACGLIVEILTQGDLGHRALKPSSEPTAGPVAPSQGLDVPVNVAAKKSTGETCPPSGCG